MLRRGKDGEKDALEQRRRRERNWLNSTIESIDRSIENRKKWSSYPFGWRKKEKEGEEGEKYNTSQLVHYLPGWLLISISKYVQVYWLESVDEKASRIYTYIYSYIIYDFRLLVRPRALLSRQADNRGSSKKGDLCRHSKYVLLFLLSLITMTNE